MFCASLRRRPSFAPVCNHLTLTASGRLQENQLTTHDIAVPAGVNADPRTTTKTSDRRLRVLLFAPSAVSDKKLESTIERIKALVNQTDAKLDHIAIVFLLCPPRDTSFASANLAAQDNGNDTTASVLAYMNLQVELRNHKDIRSIAILPLTSLEGLPALIKKHARAVSEQCSITASPATNTFELLTQCSTQPPMREQTAYVCTDIFKDLREMAQSCMNSSSAPASSSPSARAGRSSQHFGQQYDINDVPMFSEDSAPSRAQKKLKMLRDMVGNQESENAVDFWREEFAVG